MAAPLGNIMTCDTMATGPPPPFQSYNVVATGPSDCGMGSDYYFPAVIINTTTPARDHHHGTDDYHGADDHHGTDDHDDHWDRADHHEPPHDQLPHDGPPDDGPSPDQPAASAAFPPRRRELPQRGDRRLRG